MAAEVDAWMAKYENPRKQLVQAVREIVADFRVSDNLTVFASFNPKSKQHASLMFHTGASIKGDFPSLEGGEAVARYMRFANMDDVNAKAEELRRIVVAWCDQKDGA